MNRTTLIIVIIGAAFIFTTEHVFAGTFTFQCSKDCYISVLQKTKSHNMSSNLIRSTLKDGEYRNTLLKFDALDELSELKIESAKLKIFITSISGFPEIKDQKIIIYSLKKMWNEHATWENLGLAMKKWKISGAKDPSDRGEPVGEKALADIKKGKWLSIDISPELVQGWVTGTILNCGIIIVGENTKHDVYLKFPSRNSKKKELIPTLIVKTK